MANVFTIPLLNSFRWVIKDPIIDPRYNSRSFDEIIDENCYSAKWQTNDKAQIQCLSDTPPTLTFYDYYTNQVALVVTIPEIEFNILDVTFKCYQVEIEMSNLGIGDFYGVLEADDVIYETSPIAIATYWEQTILIEATNTENDKGVIFDTGIVFNFRVEGLRDRKYLPKSDNQIYTDQKYNYTQENSTPYRNFTIDIGTAQGLPNWVIDKINLYFSLDQKKVDGTYYEKSDEGASFEPTRPDVGLNEDGWWSLQVIPNENFNLQAYKTGVINVNDDYIVVRKAEPLLNLGDNVTVSGIFKTFSVLDYIKVTNKSLAAFTMRVGITDGGAEIGQWDISSDLSDVVTIRHPFEVSQDIYISGISDVSLDLVLCYDQLDAKPATPPVSGEGGFVPNALYWYFEQNDGEFETHWNIATGLGRPDTPFDGCAMCGTNGIPDLTGTGIIGWDRLGNPTARQTFTGANTLTLTRDNLPAQGIELFADQANNVNGDKPNATQHVAITSNNGGLGYELHRATNGASIGLSNNLGGGVAISTLSRSLITVPFVKLVV